MAALARKAFVVWPAFAPGSATFAQRAGARTFDKIYEFQDGGGIGVGAPQFGQRRGFYGTVAYDF